MTRFFVILPSHTCISFILADSLETEDVTEEPAQVALEEDPGLLFSFTNFRFRGLLSFDHVW